MSKILKSQPRIDHSSKPRQIIVDDNDQVIGHKYHDDILTSDIYRVSALWILNSQGEALIAQRKFTKKHDPGKWGPSVAGTVDEGESYEANIEKEAEEEVGVKLESYSKLDKVRVRGEYNFFDQWYAAIINWPIDKFVPQESEVEALQWIKISDLKEEIANNPGKYLVGMLASVEIAERFWELQNENN